MELKDRLKTARKYADLTQAETVAQIEGLSQPAYSQLERGESKTSSKLVEIANLFKISPTWLATGEGSMIEVPDPTQDFIDQLKASNNVQIDDGEDENYISIPIYDVIFCCGDGNNATYDFEEIKGERKFPPNFFEKKGIKPENFKLLCAKNDSMAPYINDSDEVGINLADTEIREGEVYAILLDDERMFKQVFREGNGILRLHSFNPNYPDKLIDRSNGKSLKIVGRQVYRAG